MSSVHVQNFNSNTWTKKTASRKWSVIDNQPKTSILKTKKETIISPKQINQFVEKNQCTSEIFPVNKNKSGKNNEKLSEISHIKTEPPLASSTPYKPPTVPSVNLEPNKETKIPKLVKSKTCSIIESKCILKKSISQPLSDNPIDNNLPQKEEIKTKSLNNLNTASTKDHLKLAYASPKIIELKSNFVQRETKKTEESIKIDVGTSQSNKPSNVKEIVRRLNSLTELTPPNESDFKIQETTPKQAISKAKSTLDLSSNKKLSYSKIPVNTVLRKTYPSIPCDLNNLDRDKSSATSPKQNSLNGKLAKSAHNLTIIPPPRMSLQKSDKTRTKSSWDLKTNSSRLSLPKTDSSLGKSMQNLNLLANKKKLLHKSAQNLTKVNQFEVSRNTPALQNPKNSFVNKSNSQRRDFVNQDITAGPNTQKLVKNLIHNIDGVKEKSVATKQGLKSQVQIGSAPKAEGTSRTVSSKPIGTRPSVLNSDKNTQAQSGTNFKIQSKTEPLKPVIQLAEDFNKPCGKPKLLKSEPIKPSTKKDKDLKIGKNFHPSSLDKKSSLKSKDESRIVDEPKRNKPELVQLDLKVARKFLNKVNAENMSNYYIDSYNSKVKNVSNEKKKLERQDMKKKDYDYNSDSSDDSGNISNEMELDGEESRLSSSSESLSTVLDVSVSAQDSGVDLSKIDSSPENDKKVSIFQIYFSKHPV